MRRCSVYFALAILLFGTLVNFSHYPIEVDLKNNNLDVQKNGFSNSSSLSAIDYWAESFSINHVSSGFDISPDSRLMANINATSIDIYQIDNWSSAIDNWYLLKTLKSDNHRPDSVTFSPSGSYLAIGWVKGDANPENWHPVIELWNVEGWNISRKLYPGILQAGDKDDIQIRDVAFTSPEAMLAVSVFSQHNYGGGLTVWNMTDWSILHYDRYNNAGSIQFSADGSELTVGRAVYGYDINILSTSTWEVIRELPSSCGNERFQYSPNNDYLAIPYANNPNYGINLWELDSWTIAYSLSIDADFCPSVSFSHNGSYLNSISQHYHPVQSTNELSIWAIHDAGVPPTRTQHHNIFPMVGGPNYDLGIRFSPINDEYFVIHGTQKIYIWTSDSDGDNFSDILDNCPFISNFQQADYDGDQKGDSCDVNDDGDSNDDELDNCQFGLINWTSNISNDKDSDGCNDWNGEDIDKDGDGIPDLEDSCNNGAINWLHDVSTDNDNDGCRDIDEDLDDDNDGWNDEMDVFPLNNGEWADFDLDGIGDNSDSDGDNDGWSNSDEGRCNSDPLNSSSFPEDTDEDGICDRQDPDKDGDGVDDFWRGGGESPPVGYLFDVFPLDANETQDNDTDGFGNNKDDCPNNAGNSTEDRLGCFDSDDDGFSDLNDVFWQDPNEWNDTDNDGVGDNSDQCPNTSRDFEVDSDGCSTLDSFSLGMGLAVPIGVGLGIGVIIPIVIILIVKRRRMRNEDDDWEDDEDYEDDEFQEEEETNPFVSQSRTRGGEPISGSPSIQQQNPWPESQLNGEWDDEGYEWLEHPENSDIWYWRDQQTGQWVEH